MDVELNWGAPPEEALANPALSSGFYGQVAKLLRGRPGEWAQVPREFASEDSAKNTAARIRTGRVAAMPKGQYEAVHYEKDLWVRYMAPEDDAEGEGASVRQIRQPGRAAPTAPPSGEAAKIRKWAAKQGMEVPKHGRLPQDLIDQYDEAHP